MPSATGKVKQTSQVPPNLQRAIKRVQYRDWTLELSEGNDRIAFYIDFSFWTIDTDHITEAPPNIMFTVHYPFILDLEDGSDATEDQWIRMIRSAIRSIVLHEMDEFLLVDDLQMFRPHTKDGTAIFEPVTFT